MSRERENRGWSSGAGEEGGVKLCIVDWLRVLRRVDVRLVMVATRIPARAAVVGVVGADGRGGKRWHTIAVWQITRVFVVASQIVMCA